MGCCCRAPGGLLALSGRANRAVNVRFEGNNGVTRCLPMTQSGNDPRIGSTKWLAQSLFIHLLVNSGSQQPCSSS